MQSLRTALADDAGQLIGNIEGPVQALAEAHGTRQGEFEVPETASFLQDVLENKTLRLELDDGSKLDIHVSSVSAGSRRGISRVEFSSS
jgi:hypothetical protein